jgi:hypothetical protein
MSLKEEEEATKIKRRLFQPSSADEHQAFQQVLKQEQEKLERQFWSHYTIIGPLESGKSPLPKAINETQESK